jgi:RNA polymerase sigma-70 factor (ECF subfamily)
MSLQSHADDLVDLDALGVFDARHGAFLETVTPLRPRLHRYCARMTGSVLDGEDVMQEALFEAYRKLDQYDPSRALGPWLFRIAHNRCIDFLRRRAVRSQAEMLAAEPDVVVPVEPAGPALDRALERLVIHLPPKERACLLLKDVFDHTLEEIAELVDSTPGGVKAALSRGRAKLAALPAPLASTPSPPAEPSDLLKLYLQRFNQRDWDGVRALTSADARLRVSDCFAGRLADSPYFTEYQAAQIPWRMELGQVEGETVIITFHALPAGWTPAWVVRVTEANGQVTRIADYWKCPWILPAAT